MNRDNKNKPTARDGLVFVDRRRRNRRQDPDPCSDLPLDLYHRKRRKAVERRTSGRSLAEDYQAFMAAQSGTDGEHSES